MTGWEIYHNLGNFLKLLAQIAQNFSNFWKLNKKLHFLVITAVSIFGQLFKPFGNFLLTLAGHLVNDPHSSDCLFLLHCIFITLTILFLCKYFIDYLLCLIWANLDAQTFLRIHLYLVTSYQEYQITNAAWAAPIAQWFYLHLPFWGSGL